MFLSVMLAVRQGCNCRSNATVLGVRDPREMLLTATQRPHPLKIGFTQSGQLCMYVKTAKLMRNTTVIRFAGAYIRKLQLPLYRLCMANLCLVRSLYLATLPITSTCTPHSGRTPNICCLLAGCPPIVDWFQLPFGGRLAPVSFCCGTYLSTLQVDPSASSSSAGSASAQGSRDSRSSHTPDTVPLELARA